MTDEHKPPKPTAGDTVHALTKAGLNLIPFAGGTAAELFAWVVTPPLEKRRDQWAEEIGDAIRKLGESGRVKIEDLQSNDAFIDTVLHATQAALRNSEQEKREALRNAVLNSALPHSPDESRQKMFVSYVDTLSVWHLRILRLLADPPGWFRQQGRQPPQSFFVSAILGTLQTAWPELAKEEEFCTQISVDLHNRGLIASAFRRMVTSGGAGLDENSTKFGLQFLKFISAPPAT